MIAGELEGLIEYDAFNKSEPTTQTVGGRTFSTKDGGPKPNERQTGKKLETLFNKGKEFVDKQGGFEGLQETYKNYKNYIKDDSPSDYEIGFGKSGEEKKKNMDKDKNQDKKEETIIGLPPMVAYVGIGVVVILFGVALYQSTRPATA